MKRLVPLTTIAHAINSALLVVSFANSQHRGLLIGWLGLNLLVAITALHRWQRGRERPNPPTAGKTAIYRATRNALAIAVLWTSVAVLLFPDAGTAQKVLLTCLFSGMLSGGAFALSPIPQAALVYIGVMLPGAVLALQLAPDGDYEVATFLLLMFAFFLVRSVIWNSHLFIQHVLDGIRLERAARIDGLTGLCNRLGFIAALEDVVSSGSSVGVALLDLDRFKRINTIRGRSSADTVIQSVASRLERVADGGHVVGRVGGNKFALLLSGVDPASCAWRVDQALRAIRRPTRIGHSELTVEATAGVAVADPSDSADDVLSMAELALQAGKDRARGRTTFYDPGFSAEIAARAAMECDLVRALPEGQLFLEFQPIFHSRTRSVTGCEALVRWQHPEKGRIGPDQFIPVAEDTGLIHRLGEWVLREALAVASHWPSHLYVAVNVSPVQLFDPAFPDLVGKVLAESGVSANRVVLEVTESVFIGDADAARAALRSLKDSGVQLSLDDFGTGYSSLSYLKNFPFDKLKIDRSFISDIECSKTSLDLVAAIARMGKICGMMTTIEGVENLEYLVLLSAAGCDEAQGYALSRPLSSSRVLGLCPSDAIA